ncbi:MAG: hypothetical protein B7Y43_00195 [Sphingomonas sp. 28-62-20]|uniref:putative PEP-binding protein n=1 Tax=Sphingomonas sp. 28-62-20 TaxID=1970433 RepID=UPI000BC425E4|nr:MAG: hypothetical protein B7Y43_00195 [Sphingomonas sp. 28-62-20]
MESRLSLSGERLSRDLAACFAGVGLLRPEFILRDLGQTIDAAPARRALGDYVESVCCANAGRPVWYRLTDLWSDETRALAGGRAEPEHNPMLGARGIRPGLADPALLRREIGLIGEIAARHADLHLLAPFLSDADEFVALAGVAAALHWPNRLGTMIETPAAVLDAARFIDAGASNLMVGLNDLSCLLLGRERGPPEMKEHRAVGWCLDRVAAAARGRCEWGVAGALSAATIVAAEAAGADYVSVHYADAALLAGIDPALLPDAGHVGAIKARNRAARAAFSG